MLSQLTVFLLLNGLFLLPSTLAAPISILGISIGDDKNEAATSSVAVSDLESRFLRAAQFSRVAYCSAAAVSEWKCGGPCDEVGKGVNVILAGGDDGLIPGFFVVHDPKENAIVVSHQGTNSKSLLSLLNDAEFLLDDLNTDRFTSAADKDIKVHSGFQKTFERTADDVLASVKKGLEQFNVTKVNVAGHSLGGAISALNALMLKQELDPTIEIRTTVFGMPRTGNQEFADFVDSTLGDTFTRIVNQDDPVARLPPRAIGYHHPSGEIHITGVDDKGQATKVTSCPGQDNESDECSAGQGILSVLKVDVPAHKGPYFDNISFSGKACPL